MEGIAELIERLVIANIKLYDTCDRKAMVASGTITDPKEMRQIAADDIALCKARAGIRAELNRRLGGQVQADSVKRYGE